MKMDLKLKSPSLTKDFMDRVREHKERPDALEAHEQMLNLSTTFLDSSKKLPEDLQYFTEVELSALGKVVKETQEWKAKMFKEQAEVDLSQPPVLTIRSIAEKIDSLDRKEHEGAESGVESGVDIVLNHRLVQTHAFDKK